MPTYDRTTGCTDMPPSSITTKGTKSDLLHLLSLLDTFLEPHIPPSIKMRTRSLHAHPIDLKIHLFVVIH